MPRRRRIFTDGACYKDFGVWHHKSAGYLGAHFASKFDTWGECECRRLVELFASGKVKFSDVFMNNPRTFLPDSAPEGGWKTWSDDANKYMDKLLDQGIPKEILKPTGDFPDIIKNYV